VRLNPNLPAKFEEIINRALEKDRELRYQSARDMRAELQRLKRDTDSGRGAAVNLSTARVVDQNAVSGSRKIAAVVVGLALLMSAAYGVIKLERGRAVVSDNQKVPSQGSATGGNQESIARVRSNGEQGVQLLLREWTDSVKAKDLAKNVDCYAPVLETYFLKHNISRDLVEADKSRAFNATTQIKIYELSDIAIDFQSSANATVKFKKSWDTNLSSGKEFSGEEIAELGLTLLDGRWKIVSERELQILRVERHSISGTTSVAPAVVK
jgi:hypothetical protein